MRNHHLLILVLAGAMLWSAENWAKAADPTAKGQLIHTPKPGSPERQAICDGARPYVVSNYATAPLPQPIVFKISHLSVQEPYCNLEAIPLFKDGSYMSTEYMADIAFNFCMKETAGTWKVIVDLSRTDVPDTSELQKIRGQFPTGFPAVAVVTQLPSMATVNAVVHSPVSRPRLRLLQISLLFGHLNLAVIISLEASVDPLNSAWRLPRMLPRR